MMKNYHKGSRNDKIQAIAATFIFGSIFLGWLLSLFFGD